MVETVIEEYDAGRDYDYRVEIHTERGLAALVEIRYAKYEDGTYRRKVAKQVSSPPSPKPVWSDWENIEVNRHGNKAYCAAAIFMLFGPDVDSQIDNLLTDGNE